MGNLEELPQELADHANEAIQEARQNEFIEQADKELAHREKELKHEEKLAKINAEKEVTVAEIQSRPFDEESFFGRLEGLFQRYSAAAEKPIAIDAHTETGEIPVAAEDVPEEIEHELEEPEETVEEIGEMPGEVEEEIDKPELQAESNNGSKRRGRKRRGRR